MKIPGSERTRADSSSRAGGYRRADPLHMRGINGEEVTSGWQQLQSTQAGCLGKQRWPSRGYEVPVGDFTVTGHNTHLTGTLIEALSRGASIHGATPPFHI